MINQILKQASTNTKLLIFKLILRTGDKDTQWDCPVRHWLELDTASFRHVTMGL